MRRYFKAYYKILLFTLVVCVSYCATSNTYRYLNTLLGCIITSIIHELGHVVAAIITKIQIFGVGIERKNIIPKFYTKVLLGKNASKKAIFFYAGGAIATSIIAVCILLLELEGLKKIMIISLFSSVINIVPVFKNDGYYIIRQLKMLKSRNEDMEI